MPRTQYPLLIGCCYRPPNSPMHFYEKLETILDNVVTKNILLLGDFNAKHQEWCSRDLTTHHGNALKDLMDSYGLTQLCTEPTHLNHEGKPNSLLDLVFTNNTDTFHSSVDVLPPISTSDHLPVVVHYCPAKDNLSQYNPYPSKKYIKWNFSQKHNNNMAEAFIFENWQHVFEPSLNINETWDRWKEQFFKEVKSFIGHEIKNDDHEKTTSKSAKWFNKDICRLIRAKNRLYRRATTSGKSYHWEVYCAARNKATYAIRVAKAKFYNQKAETLANPNCPPSKWWQLAKELCDLNGRNSTTIPPLRTCAQDTVKNDQEKANLLNHTFINQNTCLNLEGFPIGPTQLKSVFTIQDICPADVRKIIKSLPNKASSGSDEISYRLLKEAGPGVVGPLTTLFNLSLHSNRVPDEWKEAIVCPIFKGGRKARQDPTNYRPISLTSCVARTMEKLVNNQMLAYLSENSLLYKHQSGFLPNHSTVTQLCYLAHQWQMALEKGEQVHTVFLDLSKAYDRVSIPGLLFKLSNLGFSNTTLQWMSSFLMDRQQRVRVNGCLSTSKSPKSGIPQGTVLGPVLFLVYINDLPCSISSDCSIFADDTSVYNTGSKPPSICSILSKDMNYAADWAAEWGMLFNAEKSEHLAISTRKPDITSPHVTMNGTQIPQVTSHKHLGVNFNNTLSWQQHVDKVYTSCARRIGMIRRLRRKLHPVVLKRIYLGAVLPKLEYACPVWCGGPTQKLIKMHANFCRRNGTALPSLQTRFDYHTLVMFYKIHTKQAPSYLTSLLPPLSSRSGYTFRKLSYRFPTVSRTSTLNSFLPRAVALWNALPTNVQQASSIYTFKKLLQSHLKI